MSARFVIHTVGPKHWEYVDGGADLLARAHHSSLAEADRVGAVSVAIEAAPIAMQAVRESLDRFVGVQLVRFVLFNDDAYTAFTAVVDS